VRPLLVGAKAEVVAGKHARVMAKKALAIIILKGSEYTM
jgi:hypothetical protein